MLRRTVTWMTTLLLMVLLSTASAEGARGRGSDDCLDTAPQVLNLGLPGGDGETPEAIQDYLEATFERHYAEVALCPNRPLQINVALGSDYQILDWLGRGSVDMAVAPALSVHLLRRDGADLQVFHSVPVKERWLASATAQLISRSVVEPRADRASPEKDLEDFLDALWAVAVDRSELAAENANRFQMLIESHLSTIGFLVPVSEAQGWLERRLADGGRAGETEEIRERFWNAFFDRSCFGFGEGDPASGPICPRLDNPLRRDESPGPAGPEIQLEVVAVPPASESGRATGFRIGGTFHDELVFDRSVAQRLFKTQRVESIASAIPATLQELFGPSESKPAGKLNRQQRARERRNPFASYLRPQPYFGTRTFAFTPDESLRLLQHHQETADSRRLALVLPGGGVKAAYQSLLIDVLYGRRYLKNFDLPSSTGRAPLDVDYVIGTSGGALLGYFVARLGPMGPRDLTHLLWYRPVSDASGGSKKRPLTSSDVFGWTDLPRYASLIAIFLVFAIGLALCSFPRRSWLSPRDHGEMGLAEQPARPAPVYSMRWPLFLPLVAVLLGTPLVVRWVNQTVTVEHVAELEGMLYAILVVLAMFADQCLIQAEDVSPTNDPAASRLPAIALILGLGLMALPGLVRWGVGVASSGTTVGAPGILEKPAAAGIAYLVLGVLVSGVMMESAWRSTPPRSRGRDVGVWLLTFLVGSALALALLRSVSQAWLETLERVPLLFMGLGLTLLTLGAIRLAGRLVQSKRFGRQFGWIRSRAAGLQRNLWIRRAAATLGLVAGCLVLMDFTRPAAAIFVGKSSPGVLLLPSKLETTLGGLLVCVGALLILLGVIDRLARRSNRFRLEYRRQFVNGVGFVIVALSFVVYALLTVIAFLWPERMTLFELTFEFWFGLLVVAAAVSFVVLVVGFLASRRSGGWPRQVEEALRFLCSRHPNAHLVSRRFVRMGILAVGGLLCWNFILAPGFYGNRYAREYLGAVEEHFNREHRAVNEPQHVSADLNEPCYQGGSSSNRLTTRLLAPANALATNATHFLLAVPRGTPCPAIRQPPGSGQTWRLFSVHDGCAGAREKSEDDCRDELDLADQASLERLRDFVFASGSPFPIFAAHTPSSETEALVDGGYSNNTPVEAASLAGARQVLIVNSSNPLPTEDDGWHFASLFGSLVGNALRVPGFLYQRAQQLDRRSRENLFVVSLSPLPPSEGEKPWPFLSDFRPTTVERMITTAAGDLNRRIGMVESWGPPRYQAGRLVNAEQGRAAIEVGRSIGRSRWHSLRKPLGEPSE